MKKFICKVCDYTHEGEKPPEVCPVCHLGEENFKEVKEEE